MLRFASKAHQLTEMAALLDSLNAIILPLGMTAAASGYVSGPRAATLSPFHFASWPAAWIDIYLAENFLLVDPAARWARSTGHAITWVDLYDLLPLRDPGRRVIEAAALHGFTEGMAIPMRSADNDLALVSFGGARGPLDAAEQSFLAIIGRIAFENAERIERLGVLPKVPPLLSAREIELLGLLVRGHSDQQIGTMLGIAPPTVRFHLNNAKQKLGAVSRTHLVALVVSYGYAPI